MERNERETHTAIEEAFKKAMRETLEEEEKSERKAKILSLVVFELVKLLITAWIVFGVFNDSKLLLGISNEFANYSTYLSICLSIALIKRL